MFWKRLLIGYFVSATSLIAQELPAGTALPVMLNSAIDAGRVTPGATIKARLMQDVILPSGRRPCTGKYCRSESSQHRLRLASGGQVRSPRVR
jgi:hypothetical protein